MPLKSHQAFQKYIVVKAFAKLPFKAKNKTVIKTKFRNTKGRAFAQPFQF